MQRAVLRSVPEGAGGAAGIADAFSSRPEPGVEGPHRGETNPDMATRGSLNEPVARSAVASINHAYAAATSASRAYRPHQISYTNSMDSSSRTNNQTSDTRSQRAEVVSTGPGCRPPPFTDAPAGSLPKRDQVRLPGRAARWYRKRRVAVDPQLITVIVAGAIGVAGSLGGVVLSTILGRKAEHQRLAASDARRWLEDRRRSYSDYLVLAHAMLRDIDGAAAFLPYDETRPASAEDDDLRREALFEYHVRWDEELQPLLADLSLLAGAEVGELADRVSAALMEISGEVEVGGFFVDFYPQQFRARDLVELLRDSMRSELGLSGALHAQSPPCGDWPWPAGVPDEVEHIRRQTEIPGRPKLTARERARLRDVGE